MTSRAGGFTLLEALLAVTLLSSVAVAGASLVHTLAGRYDGERQSTLWSLAANRLLDRIGEDITASDYLAQLTPRARATPRLKVRSDHLAITTRRSGPVTRLYRWDEVSGQIFIEMEGSKGESQVPLLGNTRSVRFALEDRSLSVKLMSITGATAERQYAFAN